ncbi:MAG: hypothetical protein OHK0029_13550 [Armatimonadaceae bacterium]
MDAILKRCCSGIAVVAGSLLLGIPNAGAQPQPAPQYQDRFLVEDTEGQVGQPTQMAWGPDGRLYVMTNSNGVWSFRYSRITGKLTEPRQAVAGIGGIGIGFHRRNMYLSVWGEENTSAIAKLSDEDGDGVFGEPGETFVRIVTGIPIEAHAANQIVIKGDTLFIGIGTRTYNGRRGDRTMGTLSDEPGDRGFFQGGRGFSWGDSALNGTICWIKDLNTVADVEGSANTYQDTRRTAFFIQADDSPIRHWINPPAQEITDKLLVHSAGTRNPYGLCLDRFGNLYFTNNFNRTNTLGNGIAGPGVITNTETIGPDFENDVHDQCFMAVEGADYGYWNDNWRPANPLLNPQQPDYQRVFSLTFDNLFNRGPYALHDPANPDGLGPHSSATGCSFFYVWNLPRELQDNLFVTRWVNSIREDGANPNTLRYADVVAVNPYNGQVRRVAENFRNPIALLSDGTQRLLVADFGAGRIYALRPAVRRVDLRARLFRVEGGFEAEVYATNSGDVPANNLRLAYAQLNGVGTTASLPLNMGDVAPGETATRRIFFPLNLGSRRPARLSLYAPYSGGVSTTYLRLLTP